MDMLERVMMGLMGKEGGERLGRGRRGGSDLVVLDCFPVKIRGAGPERYSREKNQEFRIIAPTSPPPSL